MLFYYAQKGFEAYVFLRLEQKKGDDYDDNEGDISDDVFIVEACPGIFKVCNGRAYPYEIPQYGQCKRYKCPYIDFVLKLLAFLVLLIYNFCFFV